MPVKKIKLPDSSVIDVNDSRIHIYRTLTGTAADTISPYNHSKWDVTDSTVTEYVDGMVVCLKVPVAGHGTYGTGFQINNLGYKPVVYNVNSMVSTRYGVGSVIWCVYNATQTASLYINSTAAVTVTGCWQVQDYDANTNTIGYQLRTNSSTRPVSSTTYRYRLMFSSLDNSKWVPATNSTSTNATSARTVNQEVINPWGRIVYYSTTTARTAGQSLSATAQWDRYVFNLGYSFNTGTALDLTFPGPVYIKCTPQAGGGAIIDSTTPYTQSLPSSADGKIYIYLGQAYSASEVELIDYHPVLYHDGSKITMWTGATAEKEIFWCTMTSTTENNTTTWSCDKTWSEIYTAHQDGKNVILNYNGSLFFSSSIGSNSGIFSSSEFISFALIEATAIQSFVYDGVGDLLPSGWSYFTGSIGGQNDGTNWTSITIGTKTYSIPSGGATTLSALTDTTISSPTDKQILTYDNTTSKWVNADVPTELPSITGNANKILAVNNGATGVEWVTKPSSGLTNYDFTHTANTTVSGSTTTVTFAANTRGSAMLTISADLGLTIACNNGSDNYIWIKNTGSSEVDITISGVTKNSTNVSNVYVPSDGISVPAGGLCEIGVIVNTDGAFITSRNDLAL